MQRIMRTANISLKEIFNEIPLEKREETRLSFAISNRLDALMHESRIQVSHIRPRRKIYIITSSRRF